MKENVLSKLDELIEYIKDSDIFINYKKLEDRVKVHEDINNIMDKIKNHQQELINLRHIKKENAIKQVQEQIKELEDKLDRLPLYNEYIDSLKELDELMQTIVQNINESINKISL